MTLNHVNLTVFDALETRLFLEKYFGLRGQEGGNRGFQVVYDDHNLVLTLIKGRAEEVKYPPTFHVDSSSHRNNTSMPSTRASRRMASTCRRRAGNTDRGRSTSRRRADS